MILSLCAHLAERPNFAGYTYRDDLVSAAVLDCLQACERFNPVSTTSAFAYLTTTAWRAMSRAIKREQRLHFIPLHHKPRLNTGVAVQAGT
jgi:DNA-directed RNA polymerase specialized sigma subunit